MRTAAVAICSDLDAKHYALEWIRYHKHIGFDDFFIYLNGVKDETKQSLEELQLAGVHLVDWPGERMQLLAYNDFIRNRSSGYDWALFIDIDEFFVPSGFKDAKEALAHYKDYYGVAFSWKLFGSSGLEKADLSRGVIQRFTNSQIGYNRHIKTAINLKKAREYFLIDDTNFGNPHFVRIAMRAYFTIGADMKRFAMGPYYTPDESAVFPWIAHYIVKSREEFIERRSMKRADTGEVRADLEEFWSQHDLNEVENLEVLNFSR